MGSVGQSGSYTSTCTEYTDIFDEILGGNVGLVASKLCTVVCNKRHRCDHARRAFLQLVDPLVIDVMRTIKGFQTPS